MYSRKFTKLILLLAVIFGCSLPSTSQVGRRLYLVTGMRTPYEELKVPSSVFAVDEGRHLLVRVTDLVDASQGSNFILADHQRRFVVIGSPNLQPTRVVVLNMDNPASPRTVPILVESGAVETFLLDRPGTVLSLLTYVQGKFSLTGVNLTAPDSVQGELKWEDYRYMRRSGSWSPGDEPGGRFVIASKDGKVVSNRGGAAVDMNISLPKGFESEAEQTFQIAVNNDEILVVDRSKERGKGIIGAVGSTRLSVFDKRAQTWHTETFTGGGSSVRGFGHWVALKEAEIRVDLSKATVDRTESELESAGKAFRQRIINPQAPVRDQVTIDSTFVTSPLYFTGTIHFYDVRSQKRYRLDTGQADAEVLLIDGSSLYYRINDILYRAQFGATSIENTVEITKDDNVQLTHWAFLGA